MDDSERRALRERCRDVRVAHWVAALDAVGLADRCLMDAGIRALWRDADRGDHRIAGFAFTVRYVPADRPIVADGPDEFRRLAGRWYGAQPNWSERLRPGDLIVFDGSGTRDCGFIGSCNSLGWLAAGAVGCVSNAGARDTDELIKQRVPVYCRGLARGIQPQRVVVGGWDAPIQCGGVRVRPGDLVAADGDGVVVIPAGIVGEALPLALEVAAAAGGGPAP